MSARITADVAAARAVLEAGGLVAIPTETVYGLAGDAFRPETVARIFAAKARPHFDPLIVHLADAQQLPRVARDIPDLAWRLAREFWPGPLTMVLPKQEGVPDLVTSGLDTVAVRVPDHPLTTQLLRASGLALAAPSANPFGYLSPTLASHVAEQLGDTIDLILDGGPCRVGVESTIVRVDASGVTLLRPGGISVEQLESVCGSVQTLAPGRHQQPVAPGLLPSHYAPRKPLQLVEDWPSLAERSQLGCLTCEQPAPTGFLACETLPADEHWVGAAAHFFQALHRLDQAPVAGLVAKLFPEQGLGLALNDRLRRAAAPKEP